MVRYLFAVFAFPWMLKQARSRRACVWWQSHIARTTDLGTRQCAGFRSGRESRHAVPIRSGASSTLGSPVPRDITRFMPGWRSAAAGSSQLLDSYAYSRCPDSGLNQACPQFTGAALALLSAAKSACTTKTQKIEAAEGRIASAKIACTECGQPFSPQRKVHSRYQTQV